MFTGGVMFYRNVTIRFQKPAKTFWYPPVYTQSWAADSTTPRLRIGLRWICLAGPGTAETVAVMILG